MRRGEHAADDSSFGRSAFGAMGRGVALIVAAVVLGVILLRATDSPEPFAAIAAEADAEDDESTGSDEEGDGDETTSSTDPVGDDTTTSTPPATVDPATIIVKVANAEAGEGVAGRFRDVVAEAGYQTVSPANAEAATTSTVYFVTADAEAAARQLAALFDPVPAVAALPDPSPVEGDLQGAQVVLVVGPDLAATG